MAPQSFGGQTYFQIPGFSVSWAVLVLCGQADVVFHLVSVTHHGGEQFKTLSHAQREPFRAFLLLRLSDAHREFEHPMIEAALRDYWIADTASPGTSLPSDSQES